MFEKLKGQLEVITQLTDELPERYRDKCFELLLAKLLVDEATEPPRLQTPPPPDLYQDDGTTGGDSANFTIPAKLRAIMRRHNVEESQLRTLVMMEDSQVHFVREPSDVTNAKGQIQWSLLLALQSALLGGDLSVDPEAVRSVCQDKGYYDKANFAAVFKKGKNPTLFQTAPIPQGNPVRLSGKGEEELAALIKSLGA